MKHKIDTEPPTAPDAAWAFARYEAIRDTLPCADFPEHSLQVADLSAVFDRYDGFVLDAFGVLNIGESAIPGAVAQVARMRAAGKRVVVLTNGASHARAQALTKYARLGFDFTPSEVVASRDIAIAAMARYPEGMLWAAITAQGARFEDIPGQIVPLSGSDHLLHSADGFLFLGAEGWNGERQAGLRAALLARPRPVIVANPDIVAPREDGFTLEPGHFAHDLPVNAEFHGKPYAAALDEAVARLCAISPIPRARIAMVGDTLHTDVLGGKAARLGTVLIARHGLFRGLDPAPFITASGIVPDVIAQTT